MAVSPIPHQTTFASFRLNGCSEFSENPHDAVDHILRIIHAQAHVMGGAFEEDPAFNPEMVKMGFEGLAYLAAMAAFQMDRATEEALAARRVRRAS
jgi:hypothetical protein